MFAVLPRSVETPKKVKPNVMINMGRNVDTCDELLFVLASELVFMHGCLVAAMSSVTGGLALASIFFN